MCWRPAASPSKAPPPRSQLTPASKRPTWASRSKPAQRLALNRLWDDRIEAGKLGEPGAALLTKLVHEIAVLPGRVMRARVVAGGIDARDALRHFIAPVGVLLPGNAVLGNLFHDLGRDLDRDLLARGTVLRADRAGVQDVGLHVRILPEDSQKPVTFFVLRAHDERVGPDLALGLARLRRIAGRRLDGLTEHEVGGRLLRGESRADRDDVVAARDEDDIVGLGQVDAVPGTPDVAAEDDAPAV